MAKATLLMDDEVVFKSKSHGIVHARYNQLGNFGNVDSNYTKLFNRLSSLRPKARYVQKDFILNKEEAKEMLKIAQEMFNELKNQIPERAKTISK